MRWLQSLSRGLYSLGSRPIGKTGDVAARCRFCGTLTANKVRSDRPPLLDRLQRTRRVSLELGLDSRFSRFPSPVPVGESRPTPHSDGDAWQENIGRHGIQRPDNGSSRRYSLTVISPRGGGRRGLKNNNIAFPTVAHCFQNKRPLYVCDEWIICDNISNFAPVGVVVPLVYTL